MRGKEKLYIAKKCQKCEHNCKVQSCCVDATVTMCKKYKYKKKELNSKNKSEEDTK